MVKITKLAATDMATLQATTLNNAAATLNTIGNNTANEAVPVVIPQRSAAPTTATPKLKYVAAALGALIILYLIIK